MRLGIKFALFAFLFPVISFAQSPNLYQKVNLQLNSADPFKAVLAIQEICPQVQAEETGLKLVHSIESPGAYHYTWEQTFRGFPVVDCGVKALMNKSFRIISLMNSLQTLSAPVSEVHSVALSDAENFISQREGHGVDEYQQEVEAAWQHSDGDLRPIYRARISGIGKSFEIWYDAGTMLEINRIDRIVNYMPGGTDTTGQGTVFIPDPLTSAGENYGGIFVDSNDLTSPWIDAERIPVELLNIQYNAPNFSLSGPYVNPEDISLPAIPPPTNTTGDFSCDRANDNFEWVMVYYHLDRYQRYLQTLGYTNLQNNPLRVDAHGLSGADNSHFVPAGSDSYLEFGDGCVDDAEDADVIIHEYGHALSYAGSPNTNSGNERNGLDEGIGDYFAASYSRSINSFRWNEVFTWDGHNTCWGGRFANSTMTYPPGGFNLYDFGVIWASTMMQVWNAAGQTVADKLVIEELYSNTSNMSLNDAAHLVIDADTLLFAG